jgi:hypothetical protein
MINGINMAEVGIDGSVEVGIAGCMDPRTFEARRKRMEQLRKIYGKNVVFFAFSNGGGNVKGFRRSLMQVIDAKEANVAAIYAMQHEDCAAMKIVKEAIDNRKNPGKEVMDTLVSQFYEADLSDVDKTNSRKQIEELQTLTRGRSIDVEAAYISKADMTERVHEHSAVMILDPFYIDYSGIADKLKVDLGGMYVLQTFRNPEDFIPDLGILRSLDFKKVTVVELDGNKEMYDKAAKLVENAGMKAESMRMELPQKTQNHHKKSRI